MRGRREHVATPAPAPAPLPAIAHEDPFPPGPYRIGMTQFWAGAQDEIAQRRGYGRPYTILCADGRAICGHVESRACVEAIVAALNAQYPP